MSRYKIPTKRVIKGNLINNNQMKKVMTTMVKSAMLGGDKKLATKMINLAVKFANNPKVNLNTKTFQILKQNLKVKITSVKGGLYYETLPQKFTKAQMKATPLSFRKSTLEKLVVSGYLNANQANNYWLLTEKNRKRQEKQDDEDIPQDVADCLKQLQEQFGGVLRAIQFYKDAVIRICNYHNVTIEKVLKYYNKVGI